MHILYKHFARLLLVSGALVISAETVPMGAETPPATSKDLNEQASTKKSGKKSWKPSLRVKGEVRYDDNPFLLSEGQQRDLENAGPAEQVSGRFRDMESVSDYVFAPSVDFEAEGPGMLGRKMSLRAQVGYNRYFRNPKRSHLELDFAIEQATSKRGKTRLRFEYVPDYFQKNYLADATDTDLDGSVSASERVYMPGNYSEWDLTFDYRHQLLSSNGSSLAAWVGAGYLRRRYDAPFIGRKRNVPHAGVGLDVGLTRRLGIDFKYGFGAVDSPRLSEVLILDEPSFGVDFNGDSDASDNSVRTMQAVDRTHTEQQFEVQGKLELTKALDIRLGYERRHRNFSSHEPFDVSHNGRTDDRDTIDFVIVTRVARGMHLVAGYAYAVQDTNRSGDPASLGEITDYRRNGARVGLRFKF